MQHNIRPRWGLSVVFTYTNVYPDRFYHLFGETWGIQFCFWIFDSCIFPNKQVELLVESHKASWFMESHNVALVDDWAAALKQDIEIEFWKCWTNLG
jgi:hypothetical protein